MPSRGMPAATIVSIIRRRNRWFGTGRVRSQISPRRASPRDGRSTQPGKDRRDAKGARAPFLRHVLAIGPHECGIPFFAHDAFAPNVPPSRPCGRRMRMTMITTQGIGVSPFRKPVLGCECIDGSENEAADLVA
jgi:hypothetical protein